MKLGGVASGDRMEPSAVATNTQQATYAIPDRTKKASGCGLLLPWLVWIHEWYLNGMYIVHMMFMVLICAKYGRHSPATACH